MILVTLTEVGSPMLNVGSIVLGRGSWAAYEGESRLSISAHHALRPDYGSM